MSAQKNESPCCHCHYYVKVGDSEVCNAPSGCMWIPLVLEGWSEGCQSLSWSFYQGPIGLMREQPGWLGTIARGPLRMPPLHMAAVPSCPQAAPGRTAGLVVSDLIFQKPGIWDLGLNIQIFKH